MTDQNGHQSDAAPSGALVHLPMAAALRGFSIVKAKPVEKAPEPQKEPEEPKAEETETAQPKAETVICRNCATENAADQVSCTSCDGLLKDELKAEEPPAVAPPKNGKKKGKKAPATDKPTEAFNGDATLVGMGPANVPAAPAADAKTGASTGGRNTSTLIFNDPVASNADEKPMVARTGEGYEKLSTHLDENPKAEPPKADAKAEAAAKPATKRANTPPLPPAKPASPAAPAEPLKDEDAPERHTPKGTTPSGRTSISPDTVIGGLEKANAKLKEELQHEMTINAALHASIKEAQSDLDDSMQELSRVRGEKKESDLRLAQAVRTQPAPDPSQPLSLNPDVPESVPVPPSQTITEAQHKWKKGLKKHSATEPEQAKTIDEPVKEQPAAAAPVKDNKGAGRSAFVVLIAIVCVIVGIGGTVAVRETLKYKTPSAESTVTATATAPVQATLTQAELTKAGEPYPAGERGSGTPTCFHPSSKKTTVRGPTIDCEGAKPPYDAVQQCYDVSRCKIRYPKK